MKKEVLQQLVDSVDWWHTMQLVAEDGIITTPGKVHYTPGEATRRFGLPLNLEGKTVLDVGCWDGFFSFEAERRGARVLGIDPMLGCSNMEQKVSSFEIAALGKRSGAEFKKLSLQEFAEDVRIGQRRMRDISLYYGVLYHCDNPIQELHNLFAVTKEYALIETARTSSHMIRLKGGWEFKPGYNGDPTNKWYPSPDGLDVALKYVGFRIIESVHYLEDRFTIKAIK